MNVALFFWDRLPAPTFGGTLRMVLYLARGLAAAGHRVMLIAGEGSQMPEATVVPVDLARAERYFSHHRMTEGYLRMFRHFLAEGVLPPGERAAGAD